MKRRRPGKPAGTGQPGRPGSANRLFCLAGILVLTLLVYSDSVRNGFVYQFDDDLYVTNNPDIKAVTAGNIKSVFTTSYVGLYLPVTMLVTMAEHAAFGLDPESYHVVNLLLHLVNTALVFFLVLRLVPGLYAASLVAVVFAVHPMHVESVAWISQLKDLLYTLFYLAALLSYLDYVRNRSVRAYLFTAGLFLLSLLSKTIAVSFPLFLVGFDWYCRRRFTRAVILEKVPFVAMSLAVGLVGIHFTHGAQVADTVTPHIAWMYRPFIAASAVLLYLWKFIAPFPLMIYYYYPDTASGLPVRFFLAAAGLVLFVIAAGVAAARWRARRREMLLGFLFFVIPTVFVLQFVPAGRAYMAERYTYLSYCGLALVVAAITRGTVQGGGKRGGARTGLIAVLACFVLGFSYITRERIRDWKDSLTLFDDLVRKQPERGHPYLIRGITYMQLGDPVRALQDYDRSIERDGTDAKAFGNRAAAKGRLGDYAGAITDANRSLELDPQNDNALNNRAYARFLMQDYAGALADYNDLVARDSLNAEHYRSRIPVLEKLNDTEGILADRLALERLEPGDPVHPAQAAELYYQLGRYREAAAAATRALELGPGVHQLLFVRGNARFKLGDFEGALADFQRFAEITGDRNAFYNVGMCCLKLDRRDEACAALRKSESLGHPDAGRMIAGNCR